jgi:hypothetical protein
MQLPTPPAKPGPAWTAPSAYGKRSASERVVAGQAQPEMGKRLPRWPKFRPTGRERDRDDKQDTPKFSREKFGKVRGQKLPVARSEATGA